MRNIAKRTNLAHKCDTSILSAGYPAVSEAGVRKSTPYDVALFAKSFEHFDIRRCVRKGEYRGLAHLIGHSPRFPIVGLLFKRKSRDSRP